MNGIVGLVAFCVLCACFAAVCVAVYMWARGVDAKLELLDWRSARAGRRADEANNLIRMSWGVECKLENRIRELENEIADHRAFLNFIEDYTIEADAAPSVMNNHSPLAPTLSDCDCCNPELD